MFFALERVAVRNPRRQPHRAAFVGVCVYVSRSRAAPCVKIGVSGDSNLIAFASFGRTLTRCKLCHSRPARLPPLLNFFRGEDARKAAPLKPKLGIFHLRHRLFSDGGDVDGLAVAGQPVIEVSVLIVKLEGSFAV